MMFKDPAKLFQEIKNEWEGEMEEEEDLLQKNSIKNVDFDQMLEQIEQKIIF